MSQAVQSLYAQVVSDVITKVREHFVDEGVDEEVLLELQQIWERNLAQQRAIQSAVPEAQEQPDLEPMEQMPMPSAMAMGQPNGGPEGVADTTFNSSIAQAQYQYYSRQNDPQYMPGVRTMPHNQIMANHAPVHMQQPSQHHLYQQRQPQQQQQMQQQVQQHYGDSTSSVTSTQATYMQQQQAQYNQVNALGQQPMIQYQYMPTNYNGQIQYSANQHLPQNDGSADEPVGKRPVVEFEGLRRVSKREATLLRRRHATRNSSMQSGGSIAQADGAGDDDVEEDEEQDADEEQEADDDENAQENSQQEEDEDGDDGDDDELGSDLDDPVEEDDLDTDHLVLCQFDKVNHVKTKWKCVLKDGIMHVNNNDYVFKKATGEFDWIQH